MNPDDPPEPNVDEDLPNPCAGFSLGVCPDVPLPYQYVDTPVHGGGAGGGSGSAQNSDANVKQAIMDCNEQALATADAAAPSPVPNTQDLVEGVVGTLFGLLSEGGSILAKAVSGAKGLAAGVSGAAFTRLVQQSTVYQITY